MFLALNSDEREIASVAETFLQQEFPLERLHREALDPPCLQPFSELGWIGLTAAEDVGGSSLSAVEQVLFLLELGRVAGPVQVLTQMLAVSIAAQDSLLCAQFLTAREEVALVVENSVDRSQRFIGHDTARYAIEVTPKDATVFALKGSALEWVPCLDRSVAMWRAEAALDEALLTIQGPRVWQEAQLGVSALMIGLADAATHMIVEYAKVRETFGRKIGAYQAVRHPCADMAVRVEVARSQLYYAATVVKEGREDADLHIDATKLLAERAVKMNTDANIQLHGGIGVTDEYDAHLLLKRANLLCRLFGTGKQNMKRLLMVDDEQSAEQGGVHGP